MVNSRSQLTVDRRELIYQSLSSRFWKYYNISFQTSLNLQEIKPYNLSETNINSFKNFHNPYVQQPPICHSMNNLNQHMKLLVQ